MKKYLYGGIGFIVFIVLTYLSFSFCVLDFDPREWSESSRVGFILTGIGFGIIFSCIVFEAVEKETKIAEMNKQTHVSEGIDLSKLNKEDFKNL